MEQVANYYAIIPACVRYDNTLKPNEKLLYGEITALCNEEGYCWATNEYFAQLYEVHTKTISQWINELKEKGYLRVELVRNEKTKAIEKRIISINKKADIAIKENNITSTGENDDKSSVKETELADNFDKIWQIYPRKDGKNMAFNHYKAWLKGKNYAGRIVKLDNRQMWYATKKYADLVKENKTEKQYVKMGSTFFNDAIMEYVEVE